MKGFWAHYGMTVFLLGGIGLGCVLGLVYGNHILVLEPIGDIFLNLLFTIVVPLVFFAIASALAGLESSLNPGRLMRATVGVFTGTVLISTFLTMAAVWIWPIHNTFLQPGQPVTAAPQSAGNAATSLLTVPEFYQLLSRKSMLALILFSIGTGIATKRSGVKGVAFRSFLESGNEVMQGLLKLIMYLAPVGLGAYFACLVGRWGVDLLGAYGRAIGLITGVTFFNYFIVFSGYALLAGGIKAFRLYWKFNIIPSATALGTSSSIATIPANLDASRKMRIPTYIGDLVIPLGGPLHKEASAISEAIKIYLVCSLFHVSPGILPVLGLSLLVSVVEGGIPNGGYIGEVLTISVFGLPPEALPPMIFIGTVTDAISTLVNATGDTVSAMLITRLVKGRHWVDQAPENAIPAAAA
jgi:Na+/H+-dicarboxylate symporter